MRRPYVLVAGLLLLALAFVFAFPSGEPTVPSLDKRAEQERKQARDAFFYKMMRDPATNRIPANIRALELEHASRLQQSQLHKNGQTDPFTWFEVGPNDVGGRTRALAQDRDTPGRLLAGAVSGGLWESTDNGASWTQIALSSANLSVSYIEQDPRPGEGDTWYLSTGEFSGNSASDPKRLSLYYGTGLYVSHDDGRTWALLANADDDDPTRRDSPFEFVNRIVVSPITGTAFFASNQVGIYRLPTGATSFGPPADGRNDPAPILGNFNDHFWADIAVNSRGELLATLSSTGLTDDPTFNPGVYFSDDDGLNWQEITPQTFPREHHRSVAAFAPSNPDVAYILSSTRREISGREDTRFHWLNVATGQSENRSSSMPVYGEAGNMTTQVGYNMAIAVKPDDENFVLLGGTNLYRSRNGFATAELDRNEGWIGGYDAEDNSFALYENHHPDIHHIIFDQNDPTLVLTASDGGVHRTRDVLIPGPVEWEDLNLGYTTTQFFSVAIPPGAEDPRVAGGTQDNGTPFLRLDDLSGRSRDISSGDGGYVYFGQEYAFVTFSQGSLLRLNYNREDDPTFAGFSLIHPQNAVDPLFAHPFAVDPNDENVLYYPASHAMWRHTTIGDLRNGMTDDGITEGWEIIPGLPFIGARIITALAISTNPAHVLYYGASDLNDENPAAPRLFRLDNAPTASGGTDISIPGLEGGSYVAGIAVNPENADEILVVHSNYNIVGLHHSSNGGQSYQSVEGNLTGTEDVPGPSLRAVAILPNATGTHYFVGTSTGLYTTTTLSGGSTEWTLASVDQLNNAVVWDVKTRPADELVAVATHGRGLFMGSLDDTFNPIPTADQYRLAQNYPNPFGSQTRIFFDLPVTSTVTLSMYDLAGRKVLDIVTQQELEQGRHEYVFNSQELVSGIYLYAMVATNSQGTFQSARKMLINK